MIKKYSNILDENTLSIVNLYIKNSIKNDVWSSNLEWDSRLVNSSSIVLTHPISKNEIFFNSVKKQIEQKINLNFEKLNLDFRLAVYIWGRLSYITWHNDHGWDYNGTIYLNENWNLNYGGIFLWKDNETSEIKGIEPKFNSMVVNMSENNDDKNSHAVSMISPDAVEDRITFQWRCINIKKNIIFYI